MKKWILLWSSVLLSFRYCGFFLLRPTTRPLVAAIEKFHISRIKDIDESLRLSGAS
jgi:hypothetical protein